MTEALDDNPTGATGELAAFVLARLDEDEKRYEAEELPHLDEAERHGRIRIMYTDDGDGLLIAADPVVTPEERAPVPFPDKVAFLRAEARVMQDPDVLKLVASVYNTHPDFHEEWLGGDTAQP